LANTQISTVAVWVFVAALCSNNASGQALLDPDPMVSIPACYNSIVRYENQKPDYKTSSKLEVDEYYRRSREADQFCENKLLHFGLAVQSGYAEQFSDAFVQELTPGNEAIRRSKAWRKEVDQLRSGGTQSKRCELYADGSNQAEYINCIKGVIVDDQNKKQEHDG